MNLTNALGWTLLHFLWQGALIAGLLAGALVPLRHAGSRVRYAVSCAAMLLMLVCAVATFLELRFAGTLPDHSAPRLAITGFSAQVPGMDAVASAAAATDISAWIPALVWAWFAGVVALSLRSAGGWAMAEQFARRRTSPAEAVWEEKLAALAKRLRISKPVRLAVSGLAQVPAVVGWLRPIVLVPASVLTGLSAEQIDALLAHELAHVRRHDYPINLLQTAAETLFFYHPAAWWVSRKIRDERENCCDDLAVEICGSAVAYVRALTDLEQMRKSTPRLAMAADGGSLLNRVQRLLRAKQSTPYSWTVGVGVAAALVATVIAANALAQRAELGRAVIPEPVTKTAEVPPDDAESVLQDAESVRLQAEKLVKNVDAAMQNVDVQEQYAQIAQQDVEAQRNSAQIAQMVAALQRQVAEIDRQTAGIGQDSAEAQRMKAEVAQLQAALQQQEQVQQQVAEQVRQLNAAQQPGWLAEIQAAGYRDLTVDQLVTLREHGVTGEYIRQIRAAGQELSVDGLLRFREHGITAEFINAMKQTGFQLKADDLIRLREHGADAAWIRQIRSAGYPNVSLDDIIRLREHGVTPEAIREARNRFKDISIDQLIRLKESGVL